MGQGKSAWDVRRFRAAMVQTLPDLPGALCKNAPDPDLWHPVRPTLAAEMKAVATCHRCPVTTGCLAYAIRSHPQYGIWGGTTEAQREAMMGAEKIGGPRSIAQGVLVPA